MKNTISMLNEEYKDIILNYKTYLLYDKQLATNSVNSYIFDIEKYLLFMQNNNIDKISKITKENINMYLKHLDELEMVST